MEIFDEQRAFLTALAYRITRNWADAEDLVSQAAVRARRIDFSTVANAKAFLATMVTNLAINHVNSARMRREVVVAPEDVVGVGDSEDSSETSDLADALGKALDVMLSRLSPVERAVFLLREVFQFEYGEIAELLDHSEANCRQLLKRAREKLSGADSRFRVEVQQREFALERFLAASRDGNLDELIATVAPGVVLTRDPSNIGMPEPPPILSIEEIADHMRAYFGGRVGATWVSHRISDRYEIAMIHDATGATSAVISESNNGLIERINQITCPKRMETLTRLFALN